MGLNDETMEILCNATAKAAKSKAFQQMREQMAWELMVALVSKHNCSGEFFAILAENAFGGVNHFLAAAQKDRERPKDREEPDREGG